MEINIRKFKEIFILDLKGNFDVNSSTFIEVVGELLNQGVRKIACNMENIDLVDYMGLSGLAIAYKNVVNHKAALRFFNVPAHVRSVFALLLLDDVFEIYVSEEEAIKSFSQDEAFLRLARKKLRRRFKRLPIKLKARFKPEFSSSPDIYEGTAFNLSAIGTFIYTKDCLNLNDTLHLWLCIGPEEELEIDARVVWLADKQLQPQTAPGMGVEFYKISTELQKRIVQFVDKNLPRQTPIDV